MRDSDPPPSDEKLLPAPLRLSRSDPPLPAGQGVQPARGRGNARREHVVGAHGPHRAPAAPRRRPALPNCSRVAATSVATLTGLFSRRAGVGAAGEGPGAAPQGGAGAPQGAAAQRVRSPFQLPAHVLSWHAHDPRCCLTARRPLLAGTGRSSTSAGCSTATA